MRRVQHRFVRQHELPRLSDPGGFGDGGGLAALEVRSERAKPCSSGLPSLVFLHLLSIFDFHLNWHRGIPHTRLHHYTCWTNTAIFLAV